MKEYYDTGLGIDTYRNAMNHDGALIHAVNFVSNQYGSKTKRPGYSTFLGTADGNQVNSLINFPNIGNNAGSFNLLRASGSTIYYSQQGTGAWTATSAGTISNGGHFGAAVLNNILIGGDGVNPTMHTVDGTSFTPTSLAPFAAFFESFQGRIYAAGTGNFLSYSSAGDGTNWNTSGTSDSNTFIIPDEGKLGAIFKNTNQLIITKNTGEMFKWDGFSLIDMTTTHGPSSPYSVDSIEGYTFFINNLGNFGYGGANPTLLSNGIQRQFYNTANTGISGTTFGTAPAICHRYDYLVSVGTITDDFTSRTIPNAIIKYDYQKNEYLNWSFATQPTAWLSYEDQNNVRQLIWGDSTGQCYKMDNTVFTDNGVPIASELVYFFHGGVPMFEKKWNYWRGYFNPGCEAKVQIACSNVYSYQNLNWFDIGDVSNGSVEYRFPTGQRSRFLFLRIYDNSTTSRTTYLGCDFSFDTYEVS